MMRELMARITPAVIALSFMFTCMPASSAQQANTGNYYEGQTVAAVDVIARPGLNLGALRPLARQKANEPYSTANMQASVKAFMSTGKFTRVDVEARPEADGLHVIFILQPAFYIGMITFPGALDKFDYARLLQVVDYPAESPFDESRAHRGAAALMRFFATHGYFQAAVQTDIRLDSPRRLANVIYHITLNQHARIGRIEIVGPPSEQVAGIRGSLHSLHARLKGADLKSGKPYYPGRIQAAAGFIQEYLGKHGWLASQVVVEKPQYDSRDNRASITFDVAPGPKVSVRVTGAKVGRKKLGQLVPIFEEKSFDQDLVTEGQRNLVSYFQSKGYFDVKVAPRIETTPAEVALIYAVTRGRRHRVISVRVAGNRYFEEDDLMANVLVKKGGLFSHGKFSNDLVNQSVTNLESVYHNAGFEHVKVDPRVVDLEPKIEVTFQITEGPQTIVNSVKVEGVETEKMATLAPHGLELRAGKPYSPAEITHDRSHLVAAYLNRGYLNVSFQPVIKVSPADPHRVDVIYLIHEGIQARISQVEVVGQQHTRESFIRRNLLVKGGDPLSEGKMLRSESALYDLGIFDWASIDPARPIGGETPDAVKLFATPAAPGPAKDDVLVKVHEAKRNSITYGLGIQLTPRSGSLSTGIIALPGLPIIELPKSFKVIEKNYVSPLGSAEYSRRNIRGRGETASISTLLSRLDQRAAITYTDPEFRGLDWSSLFSLSAERTTQNPLFTARFGQASFQVERPLNFSKTDRLQFRYSFERTSLTNLLIHGFVSPEDQSIHSSTLSASFIRDTRDKPLDAHRGVYETLNFGVTPGVLGSSDSFVRFFGQGAVYHQVAPWMVLAESLRIGLESPFAGSHIPLSERFFSGGADSLRGFPINGAGPQTTAVLCSKLDDPESCTAKIHVPVGGPQLLILNSEARFPIPVMKNLGGVVFYDGGNVFNHVGFGQFFNQYSNTVGFGLRYETPVGPIRVDVGRNLSPVPGYKAYQIFFTLGQAF